MLLAYFPCGQDGDWCRKFACYLLWYDISFACRFCVFISCSLFLVYYVVCPCRGLFSSTRSMHHGVYIFS